MALALLLLVSCAPDLGGHETRGRRATPGGQSESVHPASAAQAPVSGTGAALTQEPPATSLPAPNDPEGPLLVIEESEEVVLRLFDAEEAAGTIDEPAGTASLALQVEVLSDSEALELLARLPPLVDPRQDESPALAPRSRPAPIAGMTIDTPFPPQRSLAPPKPPATGPLRVLRISPEGEVPLAPHVSVTFDQPMVALTSHDAAAALMPLRLSPELPGRARWLGTRTLLFEPDGRLPMATTFQASIDPALRSANGPALSEEVRWTFSTPPPGITSFWPPDRHPQQLEVPVVIVFDQKVDAREVASRLRVTAGTSDERIPVRLLEESELEPFPAALAVARHAAAGRLVAFRPAAPFPYGSRVRVVVPVGTPSAEGPRVTERDQIRDFRTHGPFVVASNSCSRPIGPGAGFSINFSNPIDPETAQDPTSVTIDPELPMQRHNVRGDYLGIQGLSEANTVYTLRLSPEMRDVFGQALGESPPIVCNVGGSPPSLHSRFGQMVVLDPSGPNALAIQTKGTGGLVATATSAEPRNWEEFVTWQRHQTDVQPGSALRTWELEVTGDPEEISTTLVELDEVMPKGYGHVLLRVQLFVPPGQSHRGHEVRLWVQRTRIGLVAQHGEALHVRATRLPLGEPLSGVSVYLLNPQGTVLPSRAQTGRDGRATLALGEHPATFLMARSGDDLAMLPSVGAWRSPMSGWTRMGGEDRLHVYLTNDRQMYKVGERAHFKGWVRRLAAGPRGDLEEVREGLVTWEAADPRGSLIGGGEAAVDRFGGFDFHLDVPENANNGAARVTVKVNSNGLDAELRDNFRIEAFRRPTFELTTTLGEAPHILGEPLSATISAGYYSGEPLSESEVSWSVRSQQSDHRPPGHSRFAFGRLRNFMGWHGPTSRRPQGETSLTHTGRTDAAGSHTLGLDLAGGPPLPATITIEGSVTDVDRQTWTSTTRLLVHPSALYVGLALPRRFVSRGEDLEVEAIVTDVDGAVAPGRRIALTAERLEWRQREGRWEEQTVETKTCETSSAKEPVSCVFESVEGGRWHIAATVADRRGRPSRSEIGCWVSGAPTPPPRANEGRQQRVDLVPDKDEYSPGEVAKVIALLPFHPADLTVTIMRGGVMSTEHRRVEGHESVIEVPITEELTPGMYIHVHATGAVPRLSLDGEPDPALPPIPASSAGSTHISVPPRGRDLSVRVEYERDGMTPGESTRLRLAVNDASGLPVENAQVLVVVVDDSVLALTGHRLANPMDRFYARRYSALGQSALHSLVVAAQLETELGANEEPVRTGTLGMGGLGSRGDAGDGALFARFGGYGSEAPKESLPILLRSDLSALALFAPSVVTAGDGTAEVDFTLPDNVTRYRIMAVATDGARRFGTGEATFSARLPLQARPSLPRFLTLGDEVELPVVVHNRSETELTVSLAARAAGLSMAGKPFGSPSSQGDSGEANPAGRRVVVPAGERVEVRFPAVAERMGTARVQVAATAGELSDAAEVTIPVWAPLATENFATYGTVDEGAVLQPVALPQGARTDAGGLEVTTSSTELHSLTDALVSLWGSSFGFTEEISSRVLATAALTDVLEAFEAEGLPPPDELKEALRRDLRLLAARQIPDGSFNRWRHGDMRENRWPFFAVYVGLALAVAHEKGFDVPAQTLERTAAYLQSIENRIPRTYTPEARWAIQAGALYVLSRMGRPNLGKAESMLREMRHHHRYGRRAGSEWPGLDLLGLEAQAFLLAVISADPTRFASAIDEIEGNFINRLTETAAGATFAYAYSDHAHLLYHSSRRTDAMILEALMLARPNSDLIPKIVRGLLGHRKQQRWVNTHESAWVLLALDRYFRQYEGEVPSFVARAWLGEEFAGEHAFQGRSASRRQLSVPMEQLAALGGQSELLLSKDGLGRMYYRLGIRYVPDELVPPPVERGFSVERAYEAVDDPRDVVRGQDGSWRVRAGARVRVRVTMVSPARRHHVALVDRIPAGLEPLNPVLQGVADLPGDPREAEQRLGRYWYWTRTWFEHQNLHDDRVEAFASLLWPGVHHYNYIARATTPGRFVAPPPMVEEMYNPEIFGRGRGDIVVVAEGLSETGR